MAMTNATSIASKVRSGRLKAVDVVTEAIDGAIESHDGLNAFTLIDRSGAIARAQGIDMLVGAGKDPGPLAGVPIALKDLIDQTGLPNTLGSSFEARVAENSRHRCSEAWSSGCRHHWSNGTARVCIRVHVREPVVRTGAQPVGSDNIAWRVVWGVSGRRRCRNHPDRHRDRHRRVSSGPCSHVRHLWTKGDPREGAPYWRVPPHCIFGHRWALGKDR